MLFKSKIELESLWILKLESIWGALDITSPQFLFLLAFITGSDSVF